MFKPVDQKINFPEMEKRILDWWYESGVVKKYLHKNDSSSKRFSFLDGPITANNPMGIHHGWSRTFKDLWQRYHNMKGEKQRFQNGFDCQGLWVEVEVEKELGFKSKKDIEKYGIANFVNKCKERVYKYSGIQTEQSKRLGYFADWNHSYFTMSDENNYTIWYFLKVCYDRGWIYKGHDVVPWCPRCETAISEHEILTEDYKELIHDSVFLRLKIVDRENEYLLIWTTTLWTIPANTAVAVDGDLTYVLVTDGKDKYWVAQDRMVSVFNTNAQIVKKVKGQELAGLKYISPYDDLPFIQKLTKEEKDKFHRVYVTDSLLMPVSTEEGTGLVHTSTSTGQEDFRFGKTLSLPVVPAIDDEANYLPGFGPLEGQNAKKHPELILDYLKSSGWAYKILPYKHRYPACWRCKTELVWKVADEWYVAMDRPSHKATAGKPATSFKATAGKPSGKTLREQLIEVAKKINWIPGFGLDRELDWLKNMHDWLISKKNRYWGLALPIYECKKCGSFEVIGGKDELKKRAIEGWDKSYGNSPHRPWIDEVKIKCTKCGATVSRIKDVGNPWLDAGIVSFSTITKNNQGEPLYFKDRKEWQKWFPADFITESFPGQFKNWFYSLLVMGTVLENKIPFKTVLGFATLLGEDGRPMHKSWGNAIEFNEGADKIGVDVMRWMYARQNPADNLLFGYHTADEVRRKFHLMLWNVYNFFVTYANIDKWKGSERILKQVQDDDKKENILDQWIISRLNELTGIVSDSLNKYDAQTASLSIEEFVQDLSLWYVRRSRDRIGPTVENGKWKMENGKRTWIENSDKVNCYATLYEVLVTLAKLLAPFTPFLAEQIFTNLKADEVSVHLEDWSKVNIRYINISYNEQMELVRKICELGHAARKQANIRVRQPLKRAKILRYQDTKIYPSAFKLQGVIPNGALILENSFDHKVNPNSYLKASVGIYQFFAKSKQSGILNEEYEKLIKDELNIKEIEWLEGKDELTVELDTKITPELKTEGEARELVRQIQELRKEKGCKLDEEIEVYGPFPKGFEAYIKQQTLAKKLIWQKSLKISTG